MYWKMRDNRLLRLLRLLRNLCGLPEQGDRGGSLGTLHRSQSHQYLSEGVKFSVHGIWKHPTKTNSFYKIRQHLVRCPYK